MRAMEGATVVEGSIDGRLDGEGLAVGGSVGISMGVLTGASVGAFEGETVAVGTEVGVSVVAGASVGVFVCAADVLVGAYAGGANSSPAGAPVGEYVGFSRSACWEPRSGPRTPPVSTSRQGTHMTCRCVAPSTGYGRRRGMRVWVYGATSSRVSATREDAER